MKLLIPFLLSAILGFSAACAEKDSRLFELRIYYAAPGKLDNLQARFRDHTTKLFEKHGIENIGYWLPLTNSEDKLIYLVAFPGREAREKSWKVFGADPAWQGIVKATEQEGRIVSKIESILLQPTDFSPMVKPDRASAPRLFELRTYKAASGKLEDLLARFRNHTVKLFAKHGMTQLGYWV